VSGLPFLTDDGLMAERRHSIYHALPSHPSIRLGEDSQDEVLVGAADTILPVNYTTKSRLLASERLLHCSEGRPFLVAYFLGEGALPDLSIHPLPAADLAVRFPSNSFQLDIENQDALMRGLRWHRRALQPGKGLQSRISARHRPAVPCQGTGDQARHVADAWIDGAAGTVPMQPV
jgi:hypothetical protein